jgi:hypothetical protein
MQNFFGHVQWNVYPGRKLSQQLFRVEKVGGRAGE